MAERVNMGNVQGSSDETGAANMTDQEWRLERRSRSPWFKPGLFGGSVAFNDNPPNDNPQDNNIPMTDNPADNPALPYRDNLSARVDQSLHLGQDIGVHLQSLNKYIQDQNELMFKLNEERIKLSNSNQQLVTQNEKLRDENRKLTSLVRNLHSGSNRANLTAPEAKTHTVSCKIFTGSGDFQSSVDQVIQQVSRCLAERQCHLQTTPFQPDGSTSHIPVLAFCLSTSRVGTDVDMILKDVPIKDYSNVILVIARPVAHHVTRGAPIRDMLTSEQLSKYRMVCDIRFWNEDVYTCDHNTEAIQDITSALTIPVRY